MIFDPALHEYWTDDHLVRIPGVTTMARLEPQNNSCLVPDMLICLAV